MKKLIILMMFFCSGCSLLSPIPYPDCNANFPDCQIVRIANKHEVCLKAIGNGLILANAGAIGFKVYTVQEAINTVEDGIELLNYDITDIVFREFILKKLSIYPGLIEVSSILIDDLQTGDILDKDSRMIIQGWLQNDVLPILSAYVT